MSTVTAANSAAAVANAHSSVEPVQLTGIAAMVATVRSYNSQLAKLQDQMTRRRQEEDQLSQENEAISNLVWPKNNDKGDIYVTDPSQLPAGLPDGLVKRDGYPVTENGKPLVVDTSDTSDTLAALGLKHDDLPAIVDLGQGSDGKDHTVTVTSDGHVILGDNSPAALQMYQDKVGSGTPGRTFGVSSTPAYTVSHEQADGMQKRNNDVLQQDQTEDQLTTLQMQNLLGAIGNQLQAGSELIKKLGDIASGLIHNWT
jgi:hypothetical protein